MGLRFGELFVLDESDLEFELRDLLKLELKFVGCLIWDNWFMWDGKVLMDFLV